MTLLRAPPCRLLLRLQRPAVTVPRRFLAYLKRDELPKEESRVGKELKELKELKESLHASLKGTHEHVHVRKGLHDSDIVLVDSATIIPASVAAAVSDPATRTTLY